VKTNKKQRYVLFACATVVTFMLLFPPILSVRGGGNWGYSFLFDADYESTVNIGMLLTQWVGVLIIGGILFLALRDEE
jgi:hypothetical protein